MRQASQQTEHTGDAVLDRIQENVGRLVSDVRRLISALLRLGDGVADVSMRDATYSATPEEAAAGVLRVVGPLTAARTLLLPAPSLPSTSYWRWVINDTSGGFAVNVVTLAAPTVTTAVNAGTISAVLVAPDGTRQLV